MSASGLRLLTIRMGLAALVFLFLIVNAAWIWRFRHGQPLDIDEAGYLGITMTDYHALIAGGLRRWILAVEAPSVQAPITTAMASLFFWLVGASAVAGFAVPLLAGALCVAATYCLARCVLPASSALLAAALVASCPIILNYSRSFHFAMPATAVMTLALCCLLPLCKPWLGEPFRCFFGFAAACANYDYCLSTGPAGGRCSSGAVAAGRVAPSPLCVWL